MRRPATEPDASAFARGIEALDARRTATARRLLTRAALAGGPDAAWAIQELAHLLIRDGGERAEQQLRDLLRPSGIGTALELHALAFLARLRGRLGEARKLARRALRLEPGLAAAALELGWVECRLAPGGRGLARIRRAERSLRDDAWGLSVAASHRANDAFLRFDLRSAMRRFAVAEASKQTAGDLRGLAASILHQGIIHLMTARYGEAFAAFQRAIELLERRGDLRGAGAAYNSVGLCHLDLAEPERAAAAFRIAARCKRSCGDAASLPIALGNLGYAARIGGDLRRAVRQYRAALAIASREPRADASILVANLAETLVAWSRPEEALDAVRAAPPASSLRVDFLLRRAEAHASLDLGRLREAKAALARMDKAVSGLARPQRDLAFELLDGELLRVRLAIAQADDAAAGRRMRALLRSVEWQLELAGGPRIRSGLLAKYRSVHDLWLRRLLARGETARAFALSRDLKARTLREGMRTGAPRRQGRLQDLDEIEAEVRELVNAPGLDRRQCRRLAALRRRFAERLDVEPAERRLRRLKREGLTLGALRRRLPRDMAIVEYDVSARTTTLFVVHRGGLAVREVPLGAAWIERRVARLLEPLRLAGASGSSLYLEAFDAGAAALLHRRLLAPAVDVVGPEVSRLVLVPDGPLHELPFEVLVDGRSARGEPTYVADRFALSYVPSSHLLRAARRPRPSSFLGMAFAAEGAGAFQDERGPRDLPRLGSVERETREASGAFARRELRLGRRATTAAYAQEAGRADVIHLSAHAIADADVSELGGLLLASAGGGSTGDLLTVQAVSRTRLRAALVTLAACTTAGSRRQDREGLFGLVRAFLGAGAAAVVASHWAVDDRATGELMRRFYPRLRAGQAPAVALASARSELRREGGRRRDHPYYWGAFTVVDREPLHTAAAPEPPVREGV